MVLVGRTYWNSVINFEAMRASGLIGAQDLGLFDIVDHAEEAWSSMVRRGLVAHTPADEAPGGASVL